MMITTLRSTGCALIMLAGLCFFGHAHAANPQPPEPNLEIASEWWPDLTDYWTPVGWKHHRFRYNVFFDGTIYADPGLSQTATDWKGQGVQLRVMPMPADDTKAFNRLRSERYALE